MSMVDIDEEDLKQLEYDSLFANALRMAGVDNWEGYNYALDILRIMEDNSGKSRTTEEG